jgi:hypothetical protein
METQLDNCRGQIDTLAVKRSTSGFSGASSKVADFDGDGADEVLLAIFYQTIDGTNEPMELRVMKYSDGKFIDTLVVACNSTDIASTFFPENEAGLSVSNIAWEDSVIWVSTEELNGMPVICLLHSDGGEFAGYSYLGCIDGIWQLVKQEKWSPSSQLA